MRHSQRDLEVADLRARLRCAGTVTEIGPSNDLEAGKEFGISLDVRLLRDVMRPVLR